MTRPPSIARFEQFYWASVVIGLINAVMHWDVAQAALAANPLLANATWFLPVAQIIGLAISALIWFFIARRPSVVAKWIQVVFAAFAVFGVLSTIYLVVIGRATIGTQVVLGLLSNILYIAAAVMLFKPDAKAWFGEGLQDDDDDLDMPRA
jgi:hypothetical protein